MVEMLVEKSARPMTGQRKDPPARKYWALEACRVRRLRQAHSPSPTMPARYAATRAVSSADMDNCDAPFMPFSIQMEDLVHPAPELLVPARRDRDLAGVGLLPPASG